MQTRPLGCGRVRAGFLPDRTVHLHPLDRCNLACAHCYSASGPARQTILPLAPILTALGHLRRDGYEVLSLSGGEPLLYPDLPGLLAGARSLGYRVGAITNGFRVTPGHRALLDGLDTIAVSFDGLEDLHNRIRGNARAWDAAVRALRFLGEIGKPAAAAFTVSNASLSQVPEFVELCAALGVRAVQLRPLVMAGRASSDAAELALGRVDAARLWLMAQTLNLAWEGEIAVHVDLAPAEALAADRGAWDSAFAGQEGAVMSDIVNPLVILPDGKLRPYTYDFPENFDLGLLSDLAPAGRHRIAQRLPRLQSLLSRTLDAAALEEGFLDWFAFQRDQARMEFASIP